VPDHPAPASKLLARFGPVALVTGASSGIGLEFARVLASQGFDLLLVARRGDALAAIGQDLTARYGVRVTPLPLDLSEPASLPALLSACEGISIGLVVAAAGFGTSGPFIENDLSSELDMIDVNCRAVAALSWHFARRFAAQRRGGLVLLSSLVAFQGVPRAANYAATKAYVQTLAEGLRHELRRAGVSVIASAPGPIRSGFGDRARMTMGLSQGPEAVAATTLRALGRQGTVRPGWLSKFLGWSLAALPRAARTRVMGLVMAGMTKHA
jgi:hypothetical protein